MPGTIILVSESADAQAFLRQELLNHNPALTIKPVLLGDHLVSLSHADLQHGRLIGFCTDLIVPAHVLERLAFGAYNFHPGPPAYPGWAPASFAVYDGAERFGATAHVMQARVDSGPIIGVNIFPVPPATDQTRLEDLTLRAAIMLFERLAHPLATSPDPMPAMALSWGARRGTRRAYAEMCRIAPDMRVDELVRRICAFGAGPAELRPAVMLRGAQFWLNGSNEG